jgi:beta-glucanase (GH16 family)
VNLARRLLLPWVAAWLGLGAIGCSEPTAEPQSSSSSNWLRCESDADCENLGVEATCNRAGYCAGADGAELSQQLVLEPDFTATEIDPNVFGFETGASIRNGDAEAYTDRAENAAQEDGELVLTARAEAFEGAEYTSASLTTQGKRSFGYGRFEARIQAPDAAGTAPAFWLLPENPGKDVEVCSAADACTSGSWPAWGDIVIMTVRSETPTTVYHTASFATPDAQLGTLTRGEGGGHTTLSSSVASAFHDYAVTWTPSRIEWLVDGELRATLDTRRAEIEHPEGKNPFQQPFYLLLTLAVGGLSEPPVAADYPQQLRISSLRVWQYR